jgi:hypothetical protein
MRVRYAVLGCVVLGWGCVDTKLPAAPPAIDAGLGALASNMPKGATKPPLAPLPPNAGHGGGYAPASRGGTGANVPAATGGRAHAQQPSAAGSMLDGPSMSEGVAGGGGAASAAMPRTAAPARAGDLVITELMIDPKTLTDNEGEWIELYNATSTELELRGCELDDGSKSPHAISQVVRLAPRSYITLARQAMPGFMPSVVMPLSLTNSQDGVAVRCNGVEIDRVHYDARAGSALQSGASLSLDPGQLSAVQNDQLSAWCAATESFGPELGSPGQPNPACDPESVDAGTPPEPEPPSEPEPEE